MNDSHFDALIQRAKVAPLPDCPTSLEAKVLHRVREERVNRISLWQQIRSVVAQPGVVFAMVAVTVVVSSGVTALSSRYLDRSAPQREIASVALGFDVFQPSDFSISARKIHE